MANLRPFQVVILAVFGIAALLGLVLFATFQGFGRTEQDIGTVVIWGTLSKRQVDPALTELKTLHKEFAGVSYVEKSPDTLDADIANAIASGSGPDLVLLNQEHLVAERARLNVIPSASISERVYRDTYLPIFDIYLTEGGTYGIPLLVDPLVLYYNRSALENAGVVTPPATWEAIAGLAPSLTRLTDAQTVSRSTIGMGTYENVTNAHALLSTLFFQAGQTITARTAQGIRSTLGTEAGSALGVPTAESALTFYTEFANPGKTVYTWNRSLPTSRLAFATGDVVFYPGFASERTTIAATNPNLTFDVAAIPQPGTASTRVTYGRAYALVIPKASRNAGGAYETARALAAADVLPTLARTTGMAPGVRSLLTPLTTDLYEPVYYPQALIARGWLSPRPAALDSVFAAMIGNVNSGRMKPREALDTADQALNAALLQ
ncbi:MAG TPA: extracellular solute-binding protein [Candidatus Paceibacterota bacterium]|nr:extracellular solute-binding protein [Candidatus Paceibacterota bacterium]